MFWIWVWIITACAVFLIVLKEDHDRQKRQNDEFVRNYNEVSTFGYYPKYRDSRPTIPQNVRNYILAKDNYRCNHCRSPYDLQIDHIVPYSWTQNNDVNNLQVLCKFCNILKGNKFAG